MTFPTFSAGEVLRAADMNAVGLWLVKTVTIGNGVTSVPVTSCFSADYESYRIVITGGTVNSPGSIVMQLNNSTGSTYGHFGYYGSYGTATLVPYGPANGTSWTDAFIANTAGWSAYMDISNPFVSGRPTTAKAQSTSTATAYDFYLRDTNTNSNTGFTIAPLNAGVTMTGGTIRVYGYKN